MADISCDIVVVGAGVLGLCVATELTMRGRHVCVVDPGGANASSVAAGMIAPAFETLLDDGDAARAALLKRGAARWPGFADRTGIALDRTPAEWRGPDAEQVAVRLGALGFRTQRTAHGVAAPDDVRIDAVGALATLRDGLGRRMISWTVSRVERRAGGWSVDAGMDRIMAAQVVVATGVAAALPGLPASVSSLIEAIRPIKGQIGWTADVLTDRVLRGTDGYLAPGGGGTLIGATMVEDARDTAVDPMSSQRLLVLARTLTGRAIDGPVQWRVGVRGATADGLPLAGPVGDGLNVALAPRRNGWLLGPMVAKVVADGIEGGEANAAFDPWRFSLEAQSAGRC